MELNTLKIFNAVAELGSVTRAAEKLNYVQSNITARVRQLEQELGTELFYRRPRGMTLTPAGMTLLEYSRHIELLAAEAILAVGDQGEAKGPLRIGSLGSIASARLPLVLAAFHRQHPKVEVMLSTGLDDELVRDLLDYKLDGVFVPEGVVNPEIIAEPVFQEELVLVAHQDADLSRPHDACMAVLCFSLGCLYNDRLQRWLDERGLPPRRIMELRSWDGVLGCVAAGMGVSAMPRIIVGKSPVAGSLQMVPLPPHLKDITIVFARRRDTLRTKAQEEFLKMTRQQLGGERA
ncbi:MAG: LysR family transcriptional regulator [Desulfarculaceae bacterium]|nr:LysR family transcriptional regulator [Desulfarculaceae bacterium]